jgi:hypothetical protein
MMPLVHRLLASLVVAAPVCASCAPSTDTGATSTSDDGGPSDASDPNAWLDPMNAARSAVGEMPLRWDPMAAQVAQGWADGCSFTHNPDASAQYFAFGGAVALGEDISAGAPVESPPMAVANWLSEQSAYDHATNSCASGKSCGHYTQIVWSTTTGVGCAQAQCTTNSPFQGYSNWTMTVCDFSPAGNVAGQSPY